MVSGKEVHRPPTSLVQPRVLPEEAPAPGPPDPPEEGPAGPAGDTDASIAGQPDGVVGGEPAAGEPGPAMPRPARPADLASVRERIAKTLRYPAEARRMRVQGRAVIEFVLRADGHLDSLAVRQSSGDETLDRAALAAVRDAAPYPPPGIDVLVVIPVSFKLGG